jgi:hypothetical protein
VAVVLVLHGILWSAGPAVTWVLDPASGQQPPLVQSGAVPPDAHP